MQIKNIEIVNFRCFRHISIDFSQFTILMGGNNCGKSTVLHAISVFFNPSPRLSKKDYYGHDHDLEISISIKFGRLTPSEEELFGSAVLNGEMIVSRIFSAQDQSPTYSAQGLRYRGFDEFRDEPNGTKRRGIYNRLRKEIGDLPECATAEEMAIAVSEWEGAHPEQCELGEIRAFFGATNVAAGKLATKTGVHFIPAVRDVMQDTEGSKSPAIAILADINRQTFENKKEFVELVRDFNVKLSEVSDPSTVDDLRKISENLTGRLQDIYADSSLIANLEAADQVEVSFPPPSIKVRRDDLTLDVAQVGHGLQRAILFTIIQFLAERAASNDDETVNFDQAESDIVILIEEPEIYQHPLKQKILYNWFREIASEFNKVTGIRVQIVIVTHSEKFLEITEIDKLRLIRSQYLPDEGRVHTVGSLSITQFAAEMAAYAYAQAPMSDDAFKAGLHVFELRVTEGFFADKVVLVEGVSDKAIMEGYSRSKNYDLNAHGIMVISVDGKTKMDKPLFAFNHFGIPVYAIFDNDRRNEGKKGAKNPSYNCLLQRICGEENIEDWPSRVRRNYSCFDGNLESFLKESCDGEYETIREEVAAHFKLKQTDIEKTPAAVSAFVALATEKGISFPMLEEMLAVITS